MSDLSISVVDALITLPDEPDIVAKWLQTNDFSGKRGSSGKCPIARYLAAKVGHHIIVTSEAANVVIDGRLVAVTLPPAVSTFVQQFDEGWYPELEG